MKSAILVNGVPASGKSTVARALSQRLGLPLLTLDTVKEPLFTHIGMGDREHNRMLGRASYEIIFSVLGEWPDGSAAVIDAWFGFQPRAVLDAHLERAGVGQTAEVWCQTTGAELARRYGERLAHRSPGHPGAEYIPELVALNEQAQPIGCGPCMPVDTSAATPIETLVSWLATVLPDAPLRSARA
jgi:predicted kinase